jgi:hypothetical protein
MTPDEGRRLNDMNWGEIQEWIRQEHPTPDDLAATEQRIFPADHNSLDIRDTRERVKARLRLSLGDLLAKKNGKNVYTKPKMVDYLAQIRPELVAE